MGTDPDEKSIHLATSVVTPLNPGQPWKVVLAWVAAPAVFILSIIIVASVWSSPQFPQVSFPPGTLAVIAVAVAALVAPRYLLQATLPPLFVLSFGVVWLRGELSKGADYPSDFPAASFLASMLLPGLLVIGVMVAVQTASRRRRVALCAAGLFVGVWMSLTLYFRVVRVVAMRDLAHELQRFLQPVVVHCTGVDWEQEYCRLNAGFPSSTLKALGTGGIGISMYGVPVSLLGQVPKIADLNLEPYPEGHEPHLPKSYHSLQLSWLGPASTPAEMAAVEILRPEFAERLQLSDTRRGWSSYRGDWHGMRVGFHADGNRVTISFIGTYQESASAGDRCAARCAGLGIGRAP